VLAAHGTFQSLPPRRGPGGVSWTATCGCA